ncbi:MAG: hypothetical protein ABSH48_27540 [Verrucomicrobiota bacterium]|jgi:hypothetical protein
MPKEKMDPVVASIVGINEPCGSLAGDTDKDAHPVADLIHRNVYGMPTPGSKPGPRSVEQISKSLDLVRRAITGESPFAERLRKLKFPLAQMAASASEFLPEGSPAIDFLKAANSGSDEGMRAAIRRAILLDGPDPRVVQ